MEQRSRQHYNCLFASLSFTAEHTEIWKTGSNLQLASLSYHAVTPICCRRRHTYVFSGETAEWISSRRHYSRMVSPRCELSCVALGWSWVQTPSHRRSRQTVSPHCGCSGGVSAHRHPQNFCCTLSSWMVSPRHGRSGASLRSPPVWMFSNTPSSWMVSPCCVTSCAKIILSFLWNLFYTLSR